MPYNSNIITSLFGRRLGLQPLTTGQTGGRITQEFLVGPDSMRAGVTTAETTGTNLLASGVSNVVGTSAGSSSVYTLDPPIPGVMKFLNFGSTANGVYVKTANSETFNTTQQTSGTVIKSTSGGFLALVGITTAIWGVLNLTSGTSSNASGFALTTTT